MAKIYIRGERDPIEISPEKGKAIQRILNDEEIHSGRFIDLGNLSIKKSEIKGVDTRTKPDWKVQAEKIRKEEEIKYLKFRIKKLSQSPEERAKSLDFFGLLYWAMAKQMAPKEIEHKAIKNQEWFFKKNPQRIYPDARIFKNIIPCIKDIDFYQSSGVSVIEKSIQTDIKYSENVNEEKLLEYLEQTVEQTVEENVEEDFDGL